MPEFIVYIDESGDDGFVWPSDKRGSSEWLVLSAAIFRSSNEPEQVRLVDEVRAALGKKPRTILHFVDLRHDQRVLYCDRIRRAQVKLATVAVNKQFLTDSETFRRKGVLYCYTIRFLLERVSWICKDHSKPEEDGIAKITFSYRGGMSYKDLKSYIQKLRALPTEIDWDVIDDEQIDAMPHHARMGLQIADAVASSFAQGLEANRHGFTEGRYATILRPRVWYRGSGVYIGNGLKLFPKELVPHLCLEGNHRWLATEFRLTQ